MVLAGGLCVVKAEFDPFLATRASFSATSAGQRRLTFTVVGVEVAARVVAEAATATRYLAV